MNKKVLITGAGGSLGQACVEHFAALGYDIIATVSPGKKLDYHVTTNVEAHAIDLGNEDAVTNFGETVLAKNKVAAALLLAGGFAPGSLEDTDGASLKKMMAINFDTAFFLARALVKTMLQQDTGGKIVFVASKPALEPVYGKGAVAYTLSKSLLIPLAEMINAEGMKKNVKAMIVAPATIDTPANRQAMPGADTTKWVKPVQLAEAMAYLISEKSDPLQDVVLKVYG
jgi:NAD(P)-dependent dehydrogenase (short-subunit alcohol dehydrogenase family)